MQLVLPKGKVKQHPSCLPILKRVIPIVSFIEHRMEITVNQQNYFVSESCSLQHMLDFVLQQQAQGIALAVNQEIIPKNDWETYQLKPDDDIIIIKATQGG